ncbi:MAG: glycerophosphoryl diester phosphodiesterase membrane domain-containing protein [Micropruina sp.]
MSYPTPLLDRSPLDIGGFFSGTMAVLKRRLGLFVLMALLPGLVALVASALIVAVLVGAVIEITNTRQFGGLLLGFVLAGVAILVTWLVSLKVMATTSLGALEVAQGGTPDLRGLLARTKGFLPRLIPVFLAVSASLAVLAAMAGFVFFRALGAAVEGMSDNNPAAIIGLATVFLLAFPVTAAVVLYLTVRFLYFVPVMAAEGLGGFEALGLSWRLTQGSFWRTFLSYLVAQLAVSAVTALPNLVIQSLAGSFTPILDQNADPAQILAALTAQIPLLVMVSLATFAFQLIAGPAMITYTTIMYVDQVRRSDLGQTTPPAPFYAPAPTYYNTGYGYPAHPPVSQPPTAPQPGPNTPSPWAAPQSHQPYQGPTQQGPTQTPPV